MPIQSRMFFVNIPSDSVIEQDLGLVRGQLRQYVCEYTLTFHMFEDVEVPRAFRSRCVYSYLRYLAVESLLCGVFIPSHWAAEMVAASRRRARRGASRSGTPCLDLSGAWSNVPSVH